MSSSEIICGEGNTRSIGNLYNTDSNSVSFVARYYERMRFVLSVCSVCSNTRKKIRGSLLLFYGAVLDDFTVPSRVAVLLDME